MSSSQIEARLDAAKTLSAQGKSGAAIDAFSSILIDDPLCLAAYLHLSELLLRGFNPHGWRIEPAEKILSIAKQRFPNAPQVDQCIELLRTRHLQYKSLAEADGKWAQFKDLHKGQRCVIVGNGPSLNKMDLSFLKNEIVFGLNRIYLGFDRFGFTPQYLVSVNKFVLQQSAEDFKKVPCWKFLSVEGVPPLAGDEKTLIINPRHYKDIFSTDPRQGICIGSTVTYCALQIAFFMGFETVILIGVDHSFVTQGDPHKLIESQGADPNHFDPNYFGKGYKWQLPDLEGSEQMYRIADAYFRAYRHKVIDATFGGKCPVFEKADYRKLFLPEKFEREVGYENPKKEIRFFKNKYKGKRAFIVGNGPSLAKTPLHKLKGEHSFAMNRISLIYKKADWKPSFFICTTTNVADPEWNQDICNSVMEGMPSFVWSPLKPYLPHAENLYLMECTNGEAVADHAPDEWWSEDPSISVCKFGTSLLPAMQLAFYMGFSEIYLVGCDLGFKDEGANQSGSDPNHFDPNYRTPGFKADILNRNMKATHELCQRMAKKHGVKIFNATIGGSLEVYPRVDFNSLFDSDEVIEVAPSSVEHVAADSKVEPSIRASNFSPAKGSLIELLDPKYIDPYAYDKGVLEQIRQYSLLPGKRIGWNYCMDYSWLAMHCENLLRPDMRIVDIGCGPGAIHRYLEEKHGVNIIGVDTRKWENDYVDIVGNFTDSELRKQCGFADNSLDVIISTSAFEHNTPEAHQHLVETCMQALKTGGVLLTTFSVGDVFSVEESAHQWNLPQSMLESIYRVGFTAYDYAEVKRRWRNHREMPDAYRARYGKWELNDPEFLAAGVKLVK
jgi:SAM-dependent methyltransferase